MKKLAAICAALGFVGALIGFAATPSHSAPPVAGSSWANPLDLLPILPL